MVGNFYNVRVRDIRVTAGNGPVALCPHDLHTCMRTFDKQLEIPLKNKLCGEMKDAPEPEDNILYEVEGGTKKVEKIMKKDDYKIEIKCQDPITNDETDPEKAKWGRFWVQIQQGDRTPGSARHKSTIQYFEIIFYGKSMLFM